MPREERPISPEQLPEFARMYLTAIQGEGNHPLVKRHFHQVTWLALGTPGGQPIEFFVLEFREKNSAGLIWKGDEGKWGAGRWLTLSHADADVTCPPSPLSMDYFRGNPEFDSLHAALDALMASKPGNASRSKPWWQFWR